MVLDRETTMKNIRVGFAEKKKLQYLVNVLTCSGKLFNEQILEISLKWLSGNQMKKIVEKLVDQIMRSKLRVDQKREHLGYCGMNSAETAIRMLFTGDFFKPTICQGIIECLKSFNVTQGSGQKEIMEKRIDEVCRTFNLSMPEREVLVLFYLKSVDSSVDILYERVCNFVDAKSAYIGGTSRSRNPVVILTGLGNSDIEKALSNCSALLRSCILDSDFDLPPEIVGFLEGSHDIPISRRYFTDFSGSAVPLQHHTVDPRQIDMILTLAKNRQPKQSLNILLYGEPGAGKTEFARSLGKQLGLSIYEINNLDTGNPEDKPLTMFRYRALYACQRIIDTEKSLIIVDEADSILNSAPAFFSFSSSAEKGQINKVLDDSIGFIIWIVNRYNGIDDSTKRRMDFSLKFGKLSYAQRRAIWQHSLQKYKLIKDLKESEVNALASDYEISAGGIDVALRNTARIYRKRHSNRGILDVIHRLIRSHIEFIDEDMASSRIKKANAPSYSLDGLNIKGDINEIMTILERFNKCWTGPHEARVVRNMNLLLYGPPGTGKTEFAKCISRHLNRRLVIKRASDLLSMWVGGSEKNIRQAFQEAEKDTAVLFIDEADSLLGAREGAQHSWEVTQVNEMLTNMESFRGMVICATNFKQIVDCAAIRRFNIKLEFDCLTPQGVMTFYKLFLVGMPETPLTERDAAKLGAMSGLTPGDFKVVHERYSFINRKELTHEKLIEALQQEICAKNGNFNKRMGFGK
jgi:transitional endoplasmic reticulum ATPase